MARSTGIVLAVGAISLANDAVFTPMAAGGDIDFEFNWRIIPATLIAAALLGAIEQASAELAMALAYIALVTILLARIDGKPAPIENAAKALGY